MLALAPAAVMRAQSPPSASDLTARVQARYVNVRDFTADFTVTLRSALTGQTAQDRGKVSIKKPGRMRWIYQTGNRLELISDGKDIYLYMPKARTVQVTPFPKDNEASSSLLLLTGRGDLVRDFTPDGPVEDAGGEWRFTVKPKVRQADFTSLVLAVDRSTLALRGLVVNEEQGGVRQFVFANMKENTGILDSTFAFKIPAGVEVQK